jgi:hypothetical protein
MAHVSKAKFDTITELYDPQQPNLLKAGDVLIHHANKTETYKDSPYHVSMMCKHPTTGTLLCYDSCPGHNGVSSRAMAQFGDLAVVFRLNSKPDYGSAAAAIGAAMGVGGFIGAVGYSGGALGMERAARVPFHSAAFTNKTAARLAKYKQNANKPKNVICTEFCVVSYQLAIQDSADPYFPQLDGKFLSPKELESYFLNMFIFWDLAGRVTGPNRV